MHSESTTTYKHTGLSRIFKATLSSLSGLGYAVQEAAFRLELVLGACLFASAWILPIEATQRLLLIGSIFIVWVTEILNTAIESVVDDISMKYRPLAKQAKDLGSAAVFLALLNCGLCWAYILFTEREPILSWLHF